jgi:hypothetical protein
MNQMVILNEAGNAERSVRKRLGAHYHRVALNRDTLLYATQIVSRQRDRAGQQFADGQCDRREAIEASAAEVLGYSINALDFFIRQQPDGPVNARAGSFAAFRMEAVVVDARLYWADVLREEIHKVRRHKSVVQLIPRQHARGHFGGPLEEETLCHLFLNSWISQGEQRIRCGDQLRKRVLSLFRRPTGRRFGTRFPQSRSREAGAGTYSESRAMWSTECQ